MRNSVPSQGGAIVSCHVERPLDDEAWTRFSALHARRPGGFSIIALVRPPDADALEDDRLWLDRARLAAARGPFGLHTHWTSPTHARPTGGVPAERVRREAEWLVAHGFAPRFFCGGGWYTDEGVRETLRELELADCTVRSGLPGDGLLPTTHSLGQLARGVLGRLPAYVHAYFHDYDLLDPRRRLALLTALEILGRRRHRADPLSLAHGEESDALPSTIDAS
jgi:hypothetical protein